MVNKRLHAHTGDMVDAKQPAARARNAEHTRADLLRAAKRRFTVLGYERTTSRDIAADVGVNVSLINRYFGSKDGLFNAVLRESADSLEDARGLQSGSLVDSMIAGLAPDAWPEFGNEHPLLLLLRDTGADERAGLLRRRALAKAIDHVAEQADPGQVPDAEQARLRAALVLSLVAGVATLRASLPDDPLATTDPERLRDALQAATTALLGG
jgi:AcrR family transcriptional regulator